MSSAGSRQQGTPYTREAFNRQREAIKKAERQEGLILSVVSVALGVAQIVFLRWADTHLTRHAKLSVAVPAFFAYLAVVGLLLWRYLRRRSQASPRCPSCGVRLGDESVRIASATGRCDTCGGQVIS